jgi:arsenate reductase-like glutaredoxin family protein
MRPEINYSRIQFIKHELIKAKKYTFTSTDEEELIAIMEGCGYSWAEISDKINRKYRKYGITKRRNVKEKPPSEDEIKR